MLDNAKTQMEILNWQVGISVVSKSTRPKLQYSLKHWCLYLVADSIRLLDADWLSPLMCINIGVLFGIIRMVRVRHDILLSAGGIINNIG